MEIVQVTAKRAEDALKNALRQLGATIDEVDVKVIDAGGGLFKSAKLEVSLTEEVKIERERRAARDNTRREQRDGRERREPPAFEQPRDAKKDSPASFKKPEQGKPREDLKSDAKSDRGKDSAGRQQQPFQQQKPQQKPQGQQKNQPQQKPQQPKQEQPLKAKEPENRASVPDAPSEIPEKSFNETMAFLRNVIAKMGMETELKTDAHGWDLDVIVLSDDPGLIGYHGETLDSIEYLAGLVANRDTEKYVRVSLDSNNYRDKRSDSLVRLAEKMAAKCIKTEHKVSLEPMNSANRKAVHDALSGNDKVITRSEGKEPNRRVVIYFKREAKQGEGSRGEGKQTDKREFKQKNGDKAESGKAGESKEEAAERLIPPVETLETENAAPAAPVEETAAVETEQTKPAEAVETAQEPEAEETSASEAPEQKRKEGGTAIETEAK